jgi:hypothetical protein
MPAGLLTQVIPLWIWLLPQVPAAQAVTAAQVMPLLMLQVVQAAQAVTDKQAAQSMQEA